MTDNFRASLLMILTMAGFAVEDLFIKLVSMRLPMGQVLGVLGLFGTSAMLAVARRHGKRLFDPALLHPAFVTRIAGELLGVVFGFYALAQLPLSLATAIGQATPVAVTIGAALFLGEPVGWRRWSAVAVGLAGVLFILEPGTAGYQPAALASVAAVLAFAARDLATRQCPPSLSTVQLNFWGYATILPGAAALTVVDGQPWQVPGLLDWAQLLAAAVLGSTFYWTLTLALRLGEASVVGPLRYTRIMFALLLAGIFLGERADGPMLVGLALVIASGLYTVLREARIRRQRAASIAARAPV